MTVKAAECPATRTVDGGFWNLLQAPWSGLVAMVGPRLTVGQEIVDLLTVDLNHLRRRGGGVFLWLQMGSKQTVYLTIGAFANPTYPTPTAHAWMSTLCSNALSFSAAIEARPPGP